MGIEQAASDLAPLVIEIIILVSLFNFIGLLKKMISGIEQNVFLIVQQNARIEQLLREIKNKEQE